MEPWEDIVDCWQEACDDLAFVPDLTFLHVETPDRPDILAPEPDGDWWPASAVAQRLAAVHQDEPLVWSVKRGTQHTVSLLWHAQDNPPQQSLILIGAALHDITRHLSDSWHGAPFRLVHSEAAHVQRAFGIQGLAWWHHRMTEALPSSDAILYRTRPPDDVYDLIGIVALQTALAVALHRLVRYTTAAMNEIET